MKIKILIGLWILCPILLLAYHFGPGQNSLHRDRAGDLLKHAAQAEKSESWAQAVKLYESALAQIPETDVRTRGQVRLAHAKARIYAGDLPEAITDMENILTDLEKQKASAEQKREVRAALASAQYYAGWLMRLEGAAAEEWLVEVESSRQNYRLLAEETAAASPQQSAEHQKNLEATIRLARMDLSELQGLPLPKECSGCKNCSQRCRSQRAGKSEKPSEEKKEDARKSGVGKRPEGSGS